MTSQDYVIILLPGRVLPFSLYSPVNDERVREQNYNLYTIIFNVNNGSKHYWST